MSTAYLLRVNYHPRLRKAVLRVLMDDDKPLTPKAVVESAVVNCPGIRAATLFKAIKQAIETG